MDLDILMISMLDSMKKYNEFKELIPVLERLQVHRKDPVRLLIMGEFSVGKSTLINTLLKDNVIASGAVPTTAIATYLRYSEDVYFEAVLEDGVVERHNLEQLAEFTSERVTESKEHRKNIHHINLYLPNPILKDIVLIDTPGLNSANANHNEQAFKAYEEADDSLWIFKYGAVGRSTEYQMLNKLLDDGLHPIGIINMIDESEDDNIEPYLQYELRKLGKRVRKLIGISAMEAQEAYEENDQELLELSGFPQLHSILDDVKNDYGRKQERFEQKFRTFYEKLIVAFNQLLESENYQNYIKKMDNLLLEAREENKVYLEDKIEKEQQMDALHKGFKKQINQGFYLDDWVRKKDFKKLVKAIPELKEWEDFNTLFFKVSREVHKFKKDFTNYTDNLSKVVNGEGGFWKLVSTDKKTVKELRLMKKELFERQEYLNKEIRTINTLLLNLSEKKSYIIADIEEYYRSLIKKESTYIITQIDTKKEEILEKNFSAIKGLEELSEHYSYMDHLKNLMVQVPDFINSSFRNISKIQALPHLERKTKIKGEITGFNKQILSNNILSFGDEDLNVRLELPKQIEQLYEVPNYHLVNINSTHIIAGIILFAMGLFIAETIGQIQDNTSAYGSTTYESHDLDDDIYEEEYVDNTEYEVLTPTMVYNREAIGSIETVGYDVNLYEKSGDEYKETNFISEPYTTWDVYSETEHFYEIQEDYWVAKEGVRSFTPFLQEYIQPEIDGIATISLDGEEAYVYEKANAESEKVGLLGDGSYQVLAFTENGWIQIGYNAWVKYDQSILLDQQVMQDKLNMDYYGYNSGVLRTEQTTSTFIPVFAEDNRGSAIIGYLEDTSSVDIFELPNGEWARIGTNAWIESDKYLKVDWSFVPEEDGEPIGALIVETDTLNVRQKDRIDSNLLGTLKKGREVEVYEISDSTGWYRIGKEGWVSVDPRFSTFIGEYEVYPTGEPVIGQAEILAPMINVRSSEYSDSDKLGILNQSSIVNVYEISVETGWYRIGDDAWISNNDSIVSFEAHEMEEF